MTSTDATGALGGQIAGELPYLRRYARALTGSQETGDTYAAATLEAIISSPEALSGTDNLKTALFAAFNRIWDSSGAVVEDADAPDALLEQRAQWRLRGLNAKSREALLLHTIEGFSVPEVAEILLVSDNEVSELLDRAREEIGQMMTGDILIIEDEAIIAMDLHSIVTGMGHTAARMARTRSGAVEIGKEAKPDLIVADIQLADKSSGIDAVNDLLEMWGGVPVIFITAFPERLLTGARPEPAFVIAKPYSEEQVRAAVGQAMFFASTESLLATG